MPPEERLVGIALALEEALMREAWDEADDLFEIRATVYASLPDWAVPREVDDIDARILAHLERGKAEVRRESLAMGEGRRAVAAYAGTPHLRSNVVG